MPVVKCRVLPNESIEVVEARKDGARIYEYACHDGYYALRGILQGVRVFEAQGRKLDQANVE